MTPRLPDGKRQRLPRPDRVVGSHAVRIVVVGLGAMGVAAARVLGERGHAVVAIDRGAVGNPTGSSAHATRIFRIAHPDPADVRLGLRALELWEALEAASGVELIHRCGLVEVGGPHAEIVAAVRGEGASVSELDGADLPRVFPEARARPGVPVRRHAAAGVLHARESLMVQAAAAARAGVEVATDEAVAAISTHGDGARVTTSRRTIDADAVVVCAGPWTSELLDPVGLPLPLRPVLGQASYLGGGRWAERPCLMAWAGADEAGLYGLPTAGAGYKLGFNRGVPLDPADDDRRVDRAEEALLARRAADDLPGLDGGLHGSERCPWTETPDGRFIIDRVGPIVVGAGCCGHAFKFSPALGELLADLALGGRPALEAERFAIERDGLRQPTSG
jgi:sarcosine oxidase